jgi:hypothetical protein
MCLWLLLCFVPETNAFPAIAYRKGISDDLVIPIRAVSQT